MFDKVHLSAGVFHFKWGADSDWRLGKEDSVSTARTQLHHAVSGRPDADSFHRELIRYFSIFISQVNAWDSSAASHIFCSKRSLLWTTSLCSSLKVISGIQVVETRVILHSFCIARCPYAHLLVCAVFFCVMRLSPFLHKLYKPTFVFASLRGWIWIWVLIMSDLCIWFGVFCPLKVSLTAWVFVSI